MNENGSYDASIKNFHSANYVQQHEMTMYIEAEADMW